MDIIEQKHYDEQDNKKTKINLFLKMLDGTCDTIEVCENEKILDIKKKINSMKYKKNNVCDIKLIFKGKQLLNESTIKSNNIKNDDNVIIFNIYENTNNNNENTQHNITNYAIHDGIIQLVPNINHGGGQTTEFLLGQNIVHSNVIINNDSDDSDDNSDNDNNEYNNQHYDDTSDDDSDSDNDSDNNSNNNDDGYDGNFSNIEYVPTENERRDIIELMSLGNFELPLVTQMYLACAKNKDHTATALLLNT